MPLSSEERGRRRPGAALHHPNQLRHRRGATDKLLYDAGINPLDLVISRQVNDLRLAIHGSADYVTVQNWYTSSSNRTETIQAGNGQTLLSTQVDQLIQAMAGVYAAIRPHVGSSDRSTTSERADRLGRELAVASDAETASRQRWTVIRG